MYCLHHVAKMAGEVVVVTYMWWAYVCLCEEQLLLFLGGGGKVEAVLSVGCCNLLSCCGLGATEEDDGMKQVPNRFWPISDGWASLPSETWLILYSP